MGRADSDERNDHAAGRRGVGAAGVNLLTVMPFGEPVLLAHVEVAAAVDGQGCRLRQPREDYTRRGAPRRELGHGVVVIVADIEVATAVEGQGDGIVLTR